jgi:hypothetical protein
VTTVDRLRGLADPYNTRSLAGRARAKRGEWLLKTFPDLGAMRVLDLGGVAASWESLPVRPTQVVLLNERVFDVPPGGGFLSITGDACVPDDKLRREGFDLVYSNSCFEHVGGHYRREQFAETVHALAPRHWVQTPNRYFPLEPHWLFPYLQFLPTRAKVQLSKAWPGRYHMPNESRRERTRWALSVELLSRSEFAYYFPDSEIATERIAGLSKSFVAIKA